MYYIYITLRILFVLSSLVLVYLIVLPNYSTCLNEAKRNDFFINGIACKQQKEREINENFDRVCRQAMLDAEITITECTFNKIVVNAAYLSETLFVGNILNDWFYRVLVFSMVIMSFWIGYSLILKILGLNGQIQPIIHIHRDSDFQSPRYYGIPQKVID